MVGQRAKIYGSYGVIEEATRHEGGSRPGTYRIAFRLKRRAGPRFIEEVQNYDFVHPDDIHLVVSARRNPMASSIRIPGKVLAWRERLRKGSIMKPSTFKSIKRKGASRYKKKGVGKKVAGKAYQVTLLRKYLDAHPGDKYVEGVLRKLVGRRYRDGMRRNPNSKWYIGVYDITRRRYRGRSVILYSSIKPTKSRFPKYKRVIGPFNLFIEAEEYRENL